MTAVVGNAATPQIPELLGEPSASGVSQSLVVAASQSGVITHPNGEVEFTLPSGKVAKMRPGKGRDIQRASRIVDTQTEGPMALVMATVALKTTLDGKPITYEDVLELDEADVWALMAKSQSGKGLSPPIISPS